MDQRARGEAVQGTSRVFARSEHRDIDASSPQVESTTGLLTNFIIEPFLPHPSENEFYVCITSGRDADTILFTHEGGVDIGDADAKSLKLDIPVLAVGEYGQPFPTREEIQKTLLPNVAADKKDVLVSAFPPHICAWNEVLRGYERIWGEEREPTQTI